MNKKLMVIASLLFIISLVLAACAQPATPAPTSPPPAVPTEAPAAVPTEAPAAVPTEAPAAAPTEAPAAAPTEAPAAPTQAAAAPEGNIGGQLNILGWQGYDDPTIFKPFNDQYKIVVNSTYAGNNDEIVAKYKAGGPGTYDIGDINSRYLKPMIEQNMLMPLDESKLPNLSQL